MASLATTSKRLAKHPVSRGAGWLIALGGLAAAAVGGVIWYDEKSAKAAKKVPVAPPGPAPANTMPVWSKLSPQANPSAPGTFMVAIPANATFAFADDMADPNLPTIVNGLNAAVSSGTVGAPQSYDTAPAFWPNDGFANGYRISGVAEQALNLGLGPLGKKSPTSTPGVWVVTGFTAAPSA